MGHQASPVLKQFVETGHSDMLGLTMNASVLDEFSIPPINSGSGRSQAQFFVDGNHSRVSLVTRIVPSPDWFIGMDSLQVGPLLTCTALQSVYFTQLIFRSLPPAALRGRKLDRKGDHRDGAVGCRHGQWIHVHGP